MDAGFEILYEEGPCLVVCKPPGLPTQAPPGIDSLEVRIKAFLNARRLEVQQSFSSETNVALPNVQDPKHRDAPTYDVYLAVPHRLDRPASGAMVFATRRRAAQKLSRQFEYREVKKTYWACVEGRPDPAAGTWQDHLRKVYGKPQAEVVAADHPDAKLAVLHYRTLAATPWGSWLEIELETGRTHQVRIQAASRGFPLLGDFQYGSTIPFGPQHTDERLRAIALHARTLAFRHPTSKEWISVTAPVPDFWPNQ